jgi:hypothetical protein
MGMPEKCPVVRCVQQVMAGRLLACQHCTGPADWQNRHRLLQIAVVTVCRRTIQTLHEQQGTVGGKKHLDLKHARENVKAAAIRILMSIRIKAVWQAGMPAGICWHAVTVTQCTTSAL